VETKDVKVRSSSAKIATKQQQKGKRFHCGPF